MDQVTRSTDVAAMDAPSIARRALRVLRWCGVFYLAFIVALATAWAMGRGSAVGALALIAVGVLAERTAIPALSLDGSPVRWGKFVAVAFCVVLGLALLVVVLTSLTAPRP